jgi:hypothetical protein
MKDFQDLDFKKLLCGEYEAERMPGGISYNRTEPDFSKNVLNERGLLYRPVTDEYFLKNGGEKPSWPGGKTFAVCLTHDVDSVSANSFVQFLRKRKMVLTGKYPFSFKMKNLLLSLYDLTKPMKNFYSGDPYHHLEEFQKVEQEYKCHSTFFFSPGKSAITKPHITDCLYNMSDKVVFNRQKCTVAEMICELDRKGEEIGLHPSWHSFDDVSEMRRQKEALEQVLGHQIISVRQHFLHYDMQVTPRVQSEVGFKYDSTLGFNDNIGFRLGTCYPRKLCDLKENKKLPIMEVPLIVQGWALLSPKKVLRLDIDEAFKYIVGITEAVKKVGGVLTLLWHPQAISDRTWWNLYLRTLKYLNNEDAWFASVREIGDWWHENNTYIENIHPAGADEESVM